MKRPGREPADRWVEVNILPKKGVRWTQIVAGPVLTCYFAVEYRSWHYFREGSPKGATIRLRFFAVDVCAARTEIAQILNNWKRRRAKEPALVQDFWFGRHGVKGKEYDGEADVWGHDWPIAFRAYEQGAEVGLGIAQRLEKGNLKQPVPFHASRYIHLLLNQIGYGYLDEAELLAGQASGYVRVFKELNYPQPKKSNPSDGRPEVA